MNILIIEDDPWTLNSLQHSIEKLGHKVHLAENSEEAINMVVEGKFDLLISDVMMPGISGLSLVTSLRTVYFCTIPIIMMSTLHSGPLLEAAMEAGADDFISKPFSIEELEKKIKQFDKQLNL